MERQTTVVLQRSDEPGTGETRQQLQKNSQLWTAYRGDDGAASNVSDKSNAEAEANPPRRKPARKIATALS
ncbi:hypothetical protein PF005_g10974 [Phytophthora fragariae]|nr:hypothetical protein PF007_g10211 [Phytophthora fragariae]KAE9211499.1 hypothetical protein PF005_g10974 [Phytophthora fragariae]KAE9236059.1 hypothetical protein PF002_g11340 [Phytophthora fragariae]